VLIELLVGFPLMLFVSVFLTMTLGGFVRMMLSMKMMSLSSMSMVGRFFVAAAVMVFRCLFVMLGSLSMMFGCFFMVFRSLFTHNAPL
jgi:hypothetical protein